MQFASIREAKIPPRHILGLGNLQKILIFTNDYLDCGSEPNAGQLKYRIERFCLRQPQRSLRWKKTGRLRAKRTHGHVHQARCAPDQ